MKKIDLFLLIFFTVISESIPQTHIPPGNVSGVWTKANSPYIIDGEITVPNTETLIIEPGVNIIFSGHDMLIVQGRVLAIGTQQDTILFTSQQPTIGWHGIRLINVSAENDTSIFEFCIFEYGAANTGTAEQERCGGAIYVKLSKLRVSNCLFRYNLTYHPNPIYTGGGAIALVGGYQLIENCEFYENSSNFASAIIIWYTSSVPMIRNNYFHDNNGHGLINIGSGAHPEIVNNFIVSNYCTGHGLIHFSNGSGIAIFTNNTIVLNTGYGGTIYENDGSDPIFINNIIWGNEPAQVNLEAPTNLSFINCLLEGGQNAFIGGNYFQGLYQNCIDDDPEFENSEVCRLKNNSPCIGKGIDSIQLGSIWYYSPNEDFYGNLRPSPVGSNPDIGAYENPLGSPVIEVEESVNSVPDAFQLKQNFPNPFNPSTTIEFTLPQAGNVKLTVYNLLGEEVAQLVNEFKEAGVHTINFNASGLNSGVYIYKLEANGLVQTRKMTLLK